MTVYEGPTERRWHGEILRVGSKGTEQLSGAQKQPSESNDEAPEQKVARERLALTGDSSFVSGRAAPSNHGEQSQVWAR